MYHSKGKNHMEGYGYGEWRRREERRGEERRGGEKQLIIGNAIAAKQHISWSVKQAQFEMRWRLSPSISTDVEIDCFFLEEGSEGCSS
jgi:hypothetical protein